MKVFGFWQTGYKFIMEVESGAEREEEDNPFEIVRNARSSRASRSRKSSMHTIGTLDREKGRQQTKKLRKMTMNPEVSLMQGELSSIGEQAEVKGVKSEHNGIKEEEEEFSMGDFLDLGGPVKTPSKKEQELESGIRFGIASERELDSDFNLNSWQNNEVMDLEMKE